MNFTNKKVNTIILLLLILMLFLTQPLYGQAVYKDLNNYYRFPLSAGVEFQYLFPVNDYTKNYFTYDISGTLRFPLDFAPIFQPFLRAGMTQFSLKEGRIGNGETSREERSGARDLFQEVTMAEAMDLSHFNLYGLTGLQLSFRISPTFEIGCDLATGLSLSNYKNIIEEAEEASNYYYGDLNWLIQTGFHMSVNPVYNLSLDIHPHVKYLKTMGILDDFDGFFFGVGVSASYRTGKDPDRYSYITIDDFTLPPLFAGMQPYYMENHITGFLIKNNTETLLENIEISFFQKGYMDSPTPARGIEKLKKGEEAMILVYASFNHNIFSIEGITPLVGEIHITYKADGRIIEQNKSKTYYLYDKNAIIWDDDRKAASYITPSDGILKKYARFIRNACRDEVNSAYNQPIQSAIEVYYGLQEIGIIYQPDPSRSFTDVNQRRYLVDSISMPRQSLQRLSGDCDDLTVLYCSLLESTGIETGYITLPDHIFPVFNTKQPVHSCRDILPDLNMFINIDGEAWIPVEITLLDRGDFREAWRRGIASYSRAAVDKKLQINQVKYCRNIYKPITLKEKNLPMDYGNAGNIAENFKTGLSALLKEILGYYSRDLEKKEDYNEFALRCMKLGKYDMAGSALRQSVRLDKNYILPVINLGNLSFIQKNYEQSLIHYNKAAQKLKMMNNPSPHYIYLLLNISVVYFHLEEIEMARNYYKKAEEINPEITGRTLYRDYGASLKTGLVAKRSNNENLFDEIHFAQ